MDYDKLIIKLETTKKYIARLNTLKNNISVNVESGYMDLKVETIIEDSINKINALYNMEGVQK